MPTNKAKTPIIVEHEIFTTRNRGLCDAQITLGEIFCGHYDPHDTAKLLKHVAHNLECLRNLLIEDESNGRKQPEHDAMDEATG